MLDIIELTIEKGEEAGLEKGRESAQEMVLDTIFDLSGKLPIDMIERVKF